jgi:hypothetical protein
MSIGSFHTYSYTVTEVGRNELNVCEWLAQVAHAQVRPYTWMAASRAPRHCTVHTRTDR